MKNLNLFIILFLFVSTIYGQQVSNVKTGSWSDNFTWSDSIVPSNSTSIFLNYDVRVDINASCLSLNTNGHKVTIDSGYTLNVTGHKLTTTPPMGVYGNCDTFAVLGGWQSCGMFGTLIQRVTQVDTVNKTVTFEIKRCDDSLFIGNFDVGIWGNNVCYNFYFGGSSFYNVNSPTLIVTINNPYKFGDFVSEVWNGEISYPTNMVYINY